MKNLTKLLALVLCFALVAGCGSLLEGDYTSVQKHVVAVEPEREAPVVIEADEYEEITGALLTMIAAGRPSGVIRVLGSYAGDVEEDVNRACMEVSVDTPLGAWAVYYIACTVNRIISYYDAEISITYKKTPLEIANVASIRSEAMLTGELRYLMGTYQDGEAMRLSFGETAAEDVLKKVESIYYDDPSLSVLLPEVSVSFYPETGKERIMELRLQYPYTAARLGDMQEKQNEAVRELAEEVRGLEKIDALFALCYTFCDTVEYDPTEELSGEYHRQARVNLAYGALIDGKATGEGFAMAMKLLCDELDIPSYVVSGRRDSIDHCWNMVRLDGSWYHLDVSIFDPEDPFRAFLCDDETMLLHCWWDNTLYPVCGGPLSEREEEEEPTEPEETPAPTETPPESGETPSPEVTEEPVEA